MVAIACAFLAFISLVIGWWAVAKVLFIFGAVFFGVIVLLAAFGGRQ